jgi:ABC-type Zn2+ transport system substrate-binding protein/surface adhesin
VSDQGSDDHQHGTQFHYHLELTPAQLKITHTALRSLLDDFGHDQPEVLRTIHEVLDKLPDEHAIRAIQLEREIERELTTRDEQGNEPPTAA